MTMLATGAPRAPRRAARFVQTAEFWPAAALVAVLVLQLHLVFTRSINWDEFHYLSLVHEFARGELDHPLQSFHARLFAWLPMLDLSGVDQIIRGRIVMWLCEIASCASIILIARRFGSLDRALCCALAYSSVIYVVQHGFAFRYDPLAAALSMASLAILARSRMNSRAIAAFALLMGVAFMVTIKVVLLLPAFAGIAWLRWSDADFTLKQAAKIAAGPLLAALVACVLYVGHVSGLAKANDAGAMLNNSGNAMFGFLLTDKLGYFAQSALAGVPFYAALAFTLLSVVRGSHFSAAERIALAGLAAPIFLVLFYVNSFPYFYAFMLAPVAASLAAGIGPIANRFGTAMFAFVCAATAFVAWAADGPSRLDTQRSMQAGVNAMFAEPVNYFDFPAFLPQHRKANSFLTNWGVETYIAQRQPLLRDTLLEKPVPLLLTVEEEANPTLFAVMHGLPQSRLFHPDDIVALRETYRHVWGPAWVAGTALEAGEKRVWTVFVPGTYTVEGSLSIDGEAFEDGDFVTLQRGSHAVAGSENQASGLLWGEYLTPPATPAPARPYWTGF